MINTVLYTFTGTYTKYMVQYSLPEGFSGIVSIWSTASRFLGVENAQQRKLWCVALLKVLPVGLLFCYIGPLAWAMPRTSEAIFAARSTHASPALLCLRSFVT